MDSQDPSAIPIPTAYSGLIDRFRDVGFDLRSEHYFPEAFGDWEVFLVRPPLAVHIFRHRSQWFLEVGGPILDGDYFDMDVWNAFLLGQKAPLALSPFDREANLLAELLVRMEESLGLGVVGATKKCLTERLRERGMATSEKDAEDIKLKGWDDYISSSGLRARMWPQ